MAADPYKYFRIEAKELTEQLSQLVLKLEQGLDPETIAKLLRVAHTLKGAARVVKQAEIAEHAHQLEGVLEPLRDQTGATGHAVIASLLALVDRIHAKVEQLSAPPKAEPKPAEMPVRTVRAEVEEVDRLLDGVGEAHAQLVALRTSGSKLDRARQLSEVLLENTARARTTTRPAQLTHMAAELEGLLASVARGLSTGFEAMERELRQVRDAGEQLRLVSAATLFSALERAVFDDAKASGKKVAFETRGGEVRLDAHVLDGVRGALLQLTRNAVAHGIEAPVERITARKGETGRLKVSVGRAGRRVVFSVEDDGRGVDVEAVRASAVRRGLSPEPTGRSAGDWLQLLLKGGISTSGVVTELSGRGVGLDVVRAAAERLRGTVTAKTFAGRGTTFELTVPLSLASIDGLVVEAEEQTATVPLESVRGTLRLSPSEISKTTTGEAVSFRGQSIPFVPLARPLLDRARPRTGVCSAVVVESSQGLAAIGVDRLLGTATVVLRPLPDLAPVSPVVAGASIDAEGRTRLVLDAEALVAAAVLARPVEAAPETLRAPVLVIDDSLTTRMLEQSILESAGYQVDVATSAEEGLTLARQKRYALCLVDVEMPGMDGFTFIETIRADPKLHALPAILVTSRDAREDLERGQAVGAQGYVVKSQFDQAELLTRIKKLIGSWT